MQFASVVILGAGVAVIAPFSPWWHSSGPMRLVDVEVSCMHGCGPLRQIAALASILLVMTTTAGCWDALDIDKRAFVSVVGLDSWIP